MQLTTMIQRSPLFVHCYHGLAPLETRIHQSTADFGAPRCSRFLSDSIAWSTSTSGRLHVEVLDAQLGPGLEPIQLGLDRVDGLEAAFLEVIFAGLNFA